ncbi:hypothetical protein A3F66_06440 [candidate division TM6 bacterium RIFCSPHIGHO2_12_FULL_32_22]|nr:MAG: hypothetical protein A3F66_06440 [candidate division TM6 bacterium RIFCSPHIGHO2_12_FULL_32_22]
MVADVYVIGQKLAQKLIAPPSVEMVAVSQLKVSGHTMTLISHIEDKKFCVSYLLEEGTRRKCCNIGIRTGILRLY